jgi:hypothetical protein
LLPVRLTIFVPRRPINQGKRISIDTLCNKYAAAYSPLTNLLMRRRQYAQCPFVLLSRRLIGIDIQIGEIRKGGNSGGFALSECGKRRAHPVICIYDDGTRYVLQRRAAVSQKSVAVAPGSAALKRRGGARRQAVQQDIAVEPIIIVQANAGLRQDKFASQALARQLLERRWVAIRTTGE